MSLVFNCVKYRRDGRVCVVITDVTVVSILFKNQRYDSHVCNYFP